ncbi:MAG: peptidase [Rhodobacteraceae bacterium TMED38]|nr:MAG: peptidase [Rhodobacteraceae bacterium TMED38]|tara:strand:+ start:964 stop:3021 length:2058 start_codon:yes stop_codon:yes gene_type:complete
MIFFRNLNLFLCAIYVGFVLAVDVNLEIKTTLKNQKIQKEIIKKVKEDHFFKVNNIEDINNTFQERLIESLDPSKVYFTKLEFEKYGNNLNDEIFDLNNSFRILNKYFNRLIEATSYQIEILKDFDFDFSKSEYMDVYSEDNEWKSSFTELRKEWFLLTKNDLLNEILDEDLSNETDIKQTIIDRYERRIRRITQRTNEDYFSIIMNNFTSQFDPHSAYLSPKSAEDFDMQMSLSLEGIGALLGIEDDYAKVVSLVPGGPAAKSNQLSPDDRIVSIRQAYEEKSTDVVGWRIDEIVKLIRGDAGTEVELEIMPSKSLESSERKFVTLIREEVQLEEQAAKSKIININSESRNYKVGIIELPAFYIDFNAWRERDPNFRSSSRDVEDILMSFNKDNVDAVLVDLRGNSGGSLYEANKLTGLFVASGATVQVKESSGNIRPWGDGRAKQIWKKPVGVLVDRYSASASEIFAGAIQDYKRGIVIGHRTFGKGTVQRLDDLSAGQIKITESKFYRVSGSSTQAKGVEPDIVLPSTWDIEETGESSLDESLPWDTIRPIRHRIYNLNDFAIQRASENHIERLSSDPNMQYILKIRQKYDQRKNKKEVSLNINERKNDKLDRRSWILNTENARRSLLNIDTFNTYDDLETFREEIDSDEISLENDFLLNESKNIIVDYLKFSSQLIVVNQN